MTLHPTPRGMRLGRDPVLWGLGLWTAVAIVLLVVAAREPHRQAMVLWAAQPPLDLAFLWCAWRVLPAVPAGPIRRFWRVMTGAAALFVVGDSVQAGQALTHPATATAAAGLSQSICLAIGQLAVTVTMLTHPAADRGSRVRLARWLDSATVLVGGVVIAACFAVGRSGQFDPAQAGAAVVAAVAAFAAVKMVLSGSSPMHRLAAAPMVLAGVLVCAGLLDPASGESSTVLLVAQLLASPLIACGPRIQQLLTRYARNPFGSRRRKAYSKAPYAAVTAVFAALVGTVPTGTTGRLWIAVTGAIVVVALVVARQLVAFSDNATLIGRLDGTLGELRRHETQLRDQALYDGLTKLANRAHFHDELARAIQAGPVSLLLIDLDRFKTINDTMGHAAGDALLIEVAERMRTVVRGPELIARLGGDEFAVLLPGAGPDEAGAVADRILAELARPVALLHTDAVVQCSIGLATSGPGDVDQAELMSDADIAMYAAKDRGRATWVRYTPDMGSRIRRTADLAARMPEALDSGRFRLVFQPIVTLDTGRLTGGEALLRWNAGGDLGEISPVEFIPIAEESGLIVPLGRWVLWETCRQLARWRERYPAAAATRLGVNVAGRQLRDPGFAAEVRRALADNGLTGDFLTIEVTETAVFDDDAAIDTLHDLRALGVTVALDDFGTAASSLGLLLTCPVTSLKLDRSFVEEITTAERPMAVASAVSQIAATLKFDSVAEGIETPEQAEILRGLGYLYGQGYLYGRPVPPDEYAARWLTVPTGVAAN